jgi:hypothetical protein
MSTEYPWRKVVYSKLKPETKQVYFILLECGHVCNDFQGSKLPKKRRCFYCTVGHETIDEIYHEHRLLDRFFYDVKNLADKKRLNRSFGSMGNPND